MIKTDVEHSDLADKKENLMKNGKLWLICKVIYILQWHGFNYVGLHCLFLSESGISGDLHVWRLIQSHYWVYFPTCLYGFSTFALDSAGLCYMSIYNHTLITFFLYYKQYVFTKTDSPIFILLLPESNSVSGSEYDWFISSDYANSTSQWTNLTEFSCTFNHTV